jgi:hypothetical protein
VFGYFVLHPIALQKAISIKAVKINKSNIRTTYSYYSIEEIIKNIPIGGSHSGALILDVLPEKKIYETIKNGRGNCSNLAFGMAFYLLNIGIDNFKIINIFKNNILEGNGHTMFYYNEHLYDLVIGGEVLTSDRKPMSIDALVLATKIPMDLKFKKINKYCYNESNPYITKDFLYGAKIGIIQSKKVKEYFTFINRIYFNLGNTKLNKIVFDGLAIFFNKLPTVLVECSLSELFGKDYIKVILIMFWFYVIRIVCITFFVHQGYKCLKKIVIFSKKPFYKLYNELEFKV